MNISPPLTFLPYAYHSLLTIPAYAPSVVGTEAPLLSATGGGTADSVDWSNVQNRPTNVSDFTNDVGYQTATQVNAIIEGVIGSAPDALNTLEELSQALGDDPNFATTITTELGKKVNTTDLTAITNAEIDTIVAS